ncbi:MAG: hypothetical protein AMXMBFR20_12970 [Planctomycetia bacterium]
MPIEHRATYSGQQFLAQRGFAPQGVRVDQRDIGPMGEGLFRDAQDIGINLDPQYPTAPGSEQIRQTSGADADLDNAVVSRQFRGIYEHLHEIRVNQKMLTVTLSR